MNNLRDTVSERVVIGAVFQYGVDFYIDICDIVDEDCFSDILYRVVFKCIRFLFDEKNRTGIDIPVVISCSKELGYASVLDKNAIRKLSNITKINIKKENAVEFAKKIVKLKIARELYEIINNKVISNIKTITGDEHVVDIISKIEQPILDKVHEVYYGLDKSPKKFATDVQDFIDTVSSNVVEKVGLSSGFHTYDYAIGGGLRNGSLNLIAARPQHGKSLFALNIAINLSSRDIPVLYIDTEMDEIDHMPRALSILSDRKVTIDEIETGKYTLDSGKKAVIDNCIKKLESLPFDYLSVVGLGFYEILGIIRKWIYIKKKVEGHDTCVVIYDYIKSTNYDESTSKEEREILNIMGDKLYSICKKNNIPICLFAQRNREGIHKHDSGTIAGSDRLFWLSSSVAFIVKKTPEEIAEDGPDKGNSKLIIVKHRHGAGMTGHINMNFYGEYGTFVEVNEETKINSSIYDEEEEVDF